MTTCPYTRQHLTYGYAAHLAARDRPLRPCLDDGRFRHDDPDETLAVINEVANQLGLQSADWCAFMETALHEELQAQDSREAVLCGLHRLVAARQAAAPR